MRSFRRGVHDALVLDDVRDMEFLSSHQEKLQGKYNIASEFATTTGGTTAYHLYLFRIPAATSSFECFEARGGAFCRGVRNGAEEGAWNIVRKRQQC